MAEVEEAKVVEEKKVDAQSKEGEDQPHPADQWKADILTKEPAAQMEGLVSTLSEAVKTLDMLIQKYNELQAKITAVDAAAFMAILNASRTLSEKDKITEYTAKEMETMQIAIREFVEKRGKEALAAQEALNKGFEENEKSRQAEKKDGKDAKESNKGSKK